MRWKELVEQACRAGDPSLKLGVRFAPGATAARLEECEHRLGVTFPDDLRALLRESDGITETMEIEGELIETQWLMWPTGLIEERNLRTDRLGMPAGWLSFSTADGNDFAYDVHDPHGHIWVWHPIDGTGRRVADSLAVFLSSWVAGQLSI